MFKRELNEDLVCEVCEEIMVGTEYCYCVNCGCIMCEECAYALEIEGNYYCPDCQPN